MKATILLSLILLLATAAGAEPEPGIYLYFDGARSSCTVNGVGFYQVDMWIWVYPGSLSISACEFSISYPTNIVQSTLTKNFPIISADMGEPQFGWSVAYVICQEDWHWVAHQLLFVSDPVPTPLQAAPHPSPGFIAFHECLDPGGLGLQVYGGSAFVNMTSVNPDLMVWENNFWPMQDTVVAGEDLSVYSWALFNGVCEPASATFSNGYYLSTDAVITSSDIFLGSTPPVPGLPAFEKIAWADTALTVPASVPAGDYYVGVLADYGDDVTELDESNNYARGPVTVLNPRVWYILPDSTGDAPTIQAGIDSAQVADTVLVACGTYYEHDIVMKSGITLMGESDDPRSAIIDAQDQGRVISCDGMGPSTTIEGLMITGGGGYTSAGAGMYLIDSGGLIRNCVIADNQSTSSGGGVYCGNSSPLFEDCVFSGKRGNYREDDISDTQDIYGMTKYLGEINMAGALTIRTSFIGRELATSNNLLEWFLSNRGAKIQGYTNAIFSGFPTIYFAQIIADIITKQPDLSGIYHISSEPISKFKLLSLIRDKMELNIEINEYPDFHCDRSLDSTRYQKSTGFHSPKWDKLIDELIEDFSQYPE